MPDVGLTARIVNTVTNARKNISAHYDISNAMFMGQYSVLSDRTFARVCVYAYMRAYMSYGWLYAWF